jgi:hypothetical protein
MAEICEDCGRALFAGNGYPAQDAAVCYGPHDSSCPRETIKRLRAQLASAQAELAERKWIPVDSSPPGGQTCIGFDRFYNRVGECEGNGKRLVFIDGQKDDCDITHWMPLPEPPKASET